MKRYIAFAAGLALLFAGGVVARAYILDVVDVKNSAAWRKTNTAGTQKYSQCVAGAVAKCEKKGGTSAIECDVSVEPATVASTHTDQAGAQSDLQAAMTKCADKFDPNKKVWDHDRNGMVGDAGDFPAINCNVDCDAMTEGAQACSSPGAFKTALVDPDGAVRGAVSGLGGFIGVACASTAPPVGGLGTCVSGTCPGGESCTTDANCEESIDCANLGTKLILKLLKGYQKCELNCEEDVKGGKGFGGLDDSKRCCLTGTNTYVCASQDPDMGSCQAGVNGGVDGTHPAVVALGPLLRDVLNRANDDGYNLTDPLTKASPNPGNALACGNCGNGSREGWEECDGADNSLCNVPAMGAICRAADNPATGEDACECVAGLM